DIRNQHRPGAATGRIVDRELPRVTKAERPDLGQRRNRHTVDKGVVGGYDVTVRIFVGHIDVDPEQVAEQRIRILRVVEWITRRSAVAHPDIEVAVRAKYQVSTVVVRERLHDERLSAAPAQIETR